ncbi:hypothetical protein [Niabella beijingensis]|nr:hypothetical protein [Niabella beijingensis]MBZ4189586.1 hypothetical protein [Niabella beijingensis]
MLDCFLKKVKDGSGAECSKLGGIAGMYFKEDQMVASTGKIRMRAACFTR